MTWMLLHIPGMTAMQRPGQHICEPSIYGKAGELWRCPECTRRWRCRSSFWTYGSLTTAAYWRRYRWPFPFRP